MARPAADTQIAPNVAAFYAVGGSLRNDCPSYVERRADRELYEALTRHEFSYILTSRQMGKSSLVVRTATRLRKEGVTCAVLDLTAIGQNLEAEQWYYGLLCRLGEQLDLEDELDDYWHRQENVGYLQRWMRALRSVILERRSGPIVIFIDEIDAVRSLPFSTDEFFAAIRECYNRRTEDPVFERLTFSLFGVAAPSDLIRDTRTTPFNIGKRIELTDFTLEEALPLAAGLESNLGLGLLSRILYWTGGHPYLTQSLCLTVAESRNTRTHERLTVSDVDRLCAAMFLSAQARETDNNLIFVRERVLRSEADRASLLDMYGRIWKGKKVRDEEANPLVTVLRLSGITRSVGGFLRVRNRIYARVFDKTWTESNMPYAALWRQKQAYRQGILRTVMVSGVIMAAMAGLIWKTTLESRHVQGLLAQSEEEHGVQMLENDTSLGLLYLLDAQRIAPDSAPPSQWAAWYGACAGRLAHILSIGGENHGISCSGDGMAFSDDGKRLVTWHQKPDSSGNAGPDSDSAMQIWDVDTGRPHGAAITVRGDIYKAVFSPDGRWLVTEAARWEALSGNTSTGEGNDVQIWDVDTGQPHGSPLQGVNLTVQSLQFSRDGGRLLTADLDSVKLWDMATGRLLRTLCQGNNCSSAVFSPDGQSVAFTDGYKLFLGRIDSERFQTLAEGVETLHLVTFSPDGKRLFAVWHLKEDSNRALHGTGSYDQSHLLMRQWDVSSGHPVGPVRQKDVIQVLDGREGYWFVTVDRNRTVQKWDAATGQPVGRSVQLPDGYGDGATEIAVSSDGARLAALSFSDQKTLVWDIATGLPLGLPLQHRNQARVIRFSPDGSRLAVCDFNLAAVRLWDLAGKSPFRLPLKVEGQTGTSTSFSPDGGRLAVYRYDKDVQLWDTHTGRQLGTPLPITHERNGKFSAPSNGGIKRRLMQFSADGSRLAVVTGDITVRILDSATGLPQGAPMINREFVQAFALSPDGKQLAVGLLDGTGGELAARLSEGTMQLWDTTTCLPSGPPLKPTFPVFALAYRPDGKRLVVLSMTGQLQMWDLDTGRSLQPTHGATSGTTGAQFAQFHPNGNSLATLSSEYGKASVRLWAGSDGQNLQRTLTFWDSIDIVGQEQQIIGFNPSGKWLAAIQRGYRDHNGLVLWNTSDWKPTEIAWPEPYQIINALYSLDGRWLAVAAEDPTEVQNGTGAGEWTVQVLNLDDGHMNTQILRQHGQFLAMAFLPDGNLQVAASNRDYMQMWRLPTQPIENHEMELRTWLALGARLDPNKHVAAIPTAEWRGLQQELQTLQSRQTASSRR